MRATAEVNPSERPLAKIFDDKSGKRRVTGPIQYAIDGKNETAWGIDIGPGRGNVPRKAVFVFDKPIGFPEGRGADLQLVQNHGGWNSDDNQNNNLGRFRFSVTDHAQRRRAICCRCVCAMISRSRTTNGRRRKKA